MQNKGTLYWFTGLSGAGKTTIGKRFYIYLKQQGKAVVFLDGDELRDVFKVSNSYSISERKKLAFRYSRLAHLLTEQGLDVVCCTISMFHDVRSWNRAQIKKYKEIYIKVPISTLIKRDQKGIYSKLENGHSEPVVGLNTEIEEPKIPDLVIENDDHINLDKIHEAITSSLLAH